MRLPQLFDFLSSCNYFPFQVQFGSFENRDYPFQSRGVRPYERSFSLQGETPVLIGWPIGAEECDGNDSFSQTARCDKGTRTYPRLLEDLRRSAQSFNVLHRWHREPADVDNDLYLRLGIIENECLRSQSDLLEDEMRKILGAPPPMIVTLTLSDLAVVSYPAEDDTLPDARSRAFQLTDFRLRDQNFVARLYE
jgi:hypothetical protein